MCLWKSRYGGLGLALLFALVAGVSACDDDVVEPVVFPDVLGFWSGQYRVGGCVLSGAVDPFFCDDVFWNGASLILELDLEQSGPNVAGLIYQGSLVGDVEGLVDPDGLLRLDGVVGGPADDFTTWIVGWQTGLVGDTLLGSWRFRIEDNAGQGFGAATVDATLKLYGPSVEKFFGCAVEGLLVSAQAVLGSLNDPDCQLDDAAWFDVYALDGSAGESYVVTQRSTDLDAYLLVADLDEVVLGEDDDSGVGDNGTDAEITIVFDTDDTALVIATSFAPGETGEYTLTAALQPAVQAAADREAGPELRRGFRVFSAGAGKAGRALQRDPASPGSRLRQRAGRPIRPAN